jgi:hypothetical protein
MMTKLFPNLGNPIMKSIEISLQIAGGIRRKWRVPRYFIVSPLFH